MSLIEKYADDASTVVLAFALRFTKSNLEIEDMAAFDVPEGTEEQAFTEAISILDAYIETMDKTILLRARLNAIVDMIEIAEQAKLN